MESGAVFQAERTTYAEPLNWDRASLAPGSEGDGCAWSTAKDGECGWREMKWTGG